jgi:hypothetical protein
MDGQNTGQSIRGGNSPKSGMKKEQKKKEKPLYYNGTDVAPPICQSRKTCREFGGRSGSWAKGTLPFSLSGNYLHTSTLMAPWVGASVLRSYFWWSNRFASRFWIFWSLRIHTRSSTRDEVVELTISIHEDQGDGQRWSRRFGVVLCAFSSTSRYHDSGHGLLISCWHTSAAWRRGSSFFLSFFHLVYFRDGLGCLFTWKLSSPGDVAPIRLMERRT